MPEPDAIQEITTYMGFARHGVDEKRRLQIPARWRPSNSKIELTMTIWDAHEKGTCVRVFPPKQLRALLDKIENTPSDDPVKAKLEWWIGVNSEAVMVDRTGRVCLPDRMAKAAGIVNEAVFVGLLSKFEIWSPERFESQNTSYSDGGRDFYKRIA
ncbi:MAG TPA: hypothetical protein DCY13_23240 [Verrucomicrobiales bacterium]|nr:hypothetical protein [Verrucomicrobiales bacterium]